MDRVLAAAVVGVTLVAFVFASGARSPESLDVGLAWALHVGGGLVAVVALAGMLGQWWRNAPAERLVPGAVVLLAGLAVASPSWPVLGLAAVAAALVVAGRRPGGPGA